MGPAAKVQSTIAGGHLEQDLELYASICRNNVYTAEVTCKLIKGIQMLLEAVENDGKNLRYLSCSLSSIISSEEAYSGLYALVEPSRS